MVSCEEQHHKSSDIDDTVCVQYEQVNKPSCDAIFFSDFVHVCDELVAALQEVDKTAFYTHTVTSYNRYRMPSNPLCNQLAESGGLLQHRQRIRLLQDTFP